ncbi:MAG: hypothetical protein HY898_22780 [Deltaproteobacteria bacterium]|nr:hypothetical protein [Deltaproteobacteria bacterium]
MTVARRRFSGIAGTVGTAASGISCPSCASTYLWCTRAVVCLVNAMAVCTLVPARASAVENPRRPSVWKSTGSDVLVSLYSGSSGLGTSRLGRSGSLTGRILVMPAIHSPRCSRFA